MPHQRGPRARALLQVNLDEAMRLMQPVDPAGRVYSGTDALARIGLRLPGWKLIAWFFLVPGVHFAAQHFYAWVARNHRKPCQDGTCALHGGAAFELKESGH